MPIESSDYDEAELLAECQHVIEYEFQDLDLLRSALTHESGANHRLASNERLEFLGDAILGAIVCEALFLAFPHHPQTARPPVLARTPLERAHLIHPHPRRE